MTPSRLLHALFFLLLAAPAAAQPGDHTLNLKDADIRVFIATVSEITGKNFIVDPRVEGKVNVVSTMPMDAEQVYDVFESVLRVHGYAAVPAGSMVKIVPEAVAKQDGAPGADSPGPDTLVTRIIELKHVSAAELIPILAQLVPQSGQVSAHPGSNSLLITDRAGNVARIEAIIRRIDTGSDAAIEMIPLKHANAVELARTLTLLGDDKTAQVNGTAAAKVFADARTNAILLSGDPGGRLRMRTLIANLDTPLESGEGTQVYYLRYAKAEDLVPVLEQTAASLTGMTGKEGEAKAATIQAHGETNSLVISAAPAIYDALVGVVRQLDVRRAQVLIEGVIAEVSDEYASQIGVQWQSTAVDQRADGSLGEGVIGGTNFPGAGGPGGILGAAVNPLGVGGGLNIGYIGGTITLPGSDKPILQLGALVSALRGDGKTNILSVPNAVALDHQETQLKVGQEVPFLTGSYSNLSGVGGGTGGASPVNPFQTIERKDVGLNLTVTPHINEGDSVRLDIKLEVSSLAPNVAGATDLITNKREITTAVLVSDGAMLVLGGLVSEELRENVNKVPALGDIPVLGNLFRYRNTTRTKRNLMVFLKPTILRDPAIESAVSSDKYNFIRTEQLRMRDRREVQTRPEQYPVLPEWRVPLPLPEPPR
ncbi:MAG TPA: type II secretion system secretin GspD [Xanthomonadales bacterium]|nr:type II secretion system secretin GspD [Xanthomonadales bacterium]